MAQDMRDDRGMAGVPAYDRGSYDKEYSDEHIEKGHAHAHDTDRRGSAVEEDFDPEMVKRVKRKIDARLTPVLAIMYIINQIDRSNLGNAYARSQHPCYHKLVLTGSTA